MIASERNETCSTLACINDGDGEMEAGQINRRRQSRRTAANNQAITSPLRRDGARFAPRAGVRTDGGFGRHYFSTCAISEPYALSHAVLPLPNAGWSDGRCGLAGD